LVDLVPLIIPSETAPLSPPILASHLLGRAFKALLKFKAHQLVLIEAVEEYLSCHVYLVDNNFIKLDRRNIGQEPEGGLPAREVSEEFISKACAALVEFEVSYQQKFLQALNQALNGENVLNFNTMKGDLLEVIDVIRDQLTHRSLVRYLLEYCTVLELYLPNQSPLCHEIPRDSSQVPFNPRLFQLGR